MNFNNLSWKEFLTALRKSEEKEVLILDIRTADEYRKQHLCGAMHADLLEPDFQDKLNEVGKDKNIFIYCSDGQRSSHACNILAGLGFTHLNNLDGGVVKWFEAANSKEKEAQELFCSVEED